MILTGIDKKLVDMAFIGNLAGVLAALKQGANIHADNEAAFCCAARAGHTDVVALLLDHGADMHVHSDTIIRDVAVQGHTETVRLMLDRGMDVHVHNDTALRLAARFGYKELVTLLLDRGANIHAGRDEAFREAAAYGYTQTARLLLERGADIHADNDDALHRAVFNNRLEIAALLLRLNADRHIEHDEMLAQAAQNDYKDMALLLLRHGADPKAVKAPYHHDMAGWLDQLKQKATGYFLSGKPSYADCFESDCSGKPRLQDRVLDTCLFGRFATRIGVPLIASKDKTDRQLFKDIWEALPRHWKVQYQDMCVQFLKEGGLTPVVGEHTAGKERRAASDWAAGRG